MTARPARTGYETERGTGALTSYDIPDRDRVVEPVYVGTASAIAAYRAGQVVAMVPTRLPPDGRPAFKVSLLDDRPRPHAQFSPYAPVDQPPVGHRPPSTTLLSHGQKWAVIAGALLIVLLLAVWLVIQALNAVGTLLAGAGWALIAGAVILVSVAVLVRASRSGGNTVNIAAKTIRKMTFK